MNREAMEKLLEVIEIECVRQHVDETRRPMLLAGWAVARSLMEQGSKLDLATLLFLAKTVEPDSKGELRRTPVTFASGGFAVAPQNVPAAMESLLEAWQETLDSDNRAWKLEWLKELLVIHPFVDGNGRTAWVLQQWLFNTWDEPEVLVQHDFS